MIPATIFNIAKSHADAIKEVTGKHICAVGRSNLSNLVAHSYIGNLPESDQVTMADVLAAATADDGEGPSVHSIAMGAEIDSLIPLVSSHISFVRNEVCKVMYDFEEKYGSQVARLSAETPAGLFDIREMSVPAPLKDAGITGLIERFGDASFGAGRLLTSLPRQTADQLADIMRVSSSAGNTAISKWIAETGTAWLEGLWQHYFASGSMEPNGVVAFRGGYEGMISMPAFERMSVGLGLFLLSRGLLDSPMEESGMDLATWRDEMDMLSRFAGAQVDAAMISVKNLERQGTVILGVSGGGKIVAVNSEMYGKFIDAGGTIEDVLGAAISNRSQSYTMDALTAEGSGYREIWKNYQAMGQSTLNTRAVLTLRSEAKSLFYEASRGLEGEEAELLMMSKQNPETLYQRACDLIDDMGTDQLLNTSAMAMCLIAGLRYAHTPAKQILSDMKEAEAAGCTDPAEAALLAAVNYVADAKACELALTSA